jgi:hypothetical protein
MNQAATTKGPTGYFADQFDAPEPTSEEVIRRDAHIVNGGEATFQCPACKGRGRFVSYAGRDVGACFKCKGKGNVGKGVIAAAKGKQTKLANQAKFQADNADAIAYLRKRADKGSTFYQGFLAKLTEYGTLTEGQLALVYKDMAKDAEFYAAKNAEREAARPVIDISAIQTMFAKASEKLTKKPVFRMDGFQIETDRVVGHQTLWIKDTEQGKYVGKVEGGKFNAFRAANDKTLPALEAVAADPTGAAIAYARKFKACCCCGKALRNPVSVLAVVGPVCGPKWGLDHLRMEAAAMLADEAEADEQEKLR